MGHKDEFITDFKIKEEFEIKEEPDNEDIETNFRIIKLEHIFVPEQIKEEFHEDSITVSYRDDVKFKPAYVDPGLEHNYACKTEKHIRKKKNLPCEPQSCTICNQQFVRVNALERHLLSHGTTPSPYQCDICGAKFKIKQYVRRHILTVHSVFPKMKAPCTICGKWYDQNYLKMHTSRHNILNEKPSFECSICGKFFKIKENLSVHVRRHTKKTFTCTVCGKVFFSQPTLAVHQRIHTGEKPYLCSICGSRFRGKNTFYIHQTIHWTGKNFPCNICDAKFKNPNGLRGHIRKVHGKKDHGEKITKKKSTKKTTSRVTLAHPLINMNRKIVLIKNPICL